jgi:hypothetical protein
MAFRAEHSSEARIAVVGVGDRGCSFGTFSWSGIGVVGSGDGYCSFGAFSWAGLNSRPT